MPTQGYDATIVGEGGAGAAGRVVYAGDPTWKWGVSPVAGKAVVKTGTAQFETAATPPYIQSSSTAVVEFFVPLVPHLGYNSSDAPAAVLITLTSVAIRYRKDGGTDAIEAYLIAFPRDGTSAATTVDSKTTGGGDFSTSAAYAVQELLGANRDLDFSTYEYAILFSLNPDVAADDARIADVVVTATKRAVE